MKKNNKGFTLVELIIVIAIVAVLSVVLAPQYFKYVERSRISKDMDCAAAIEQALNVLYADNKLHSNGTLVWKVEGDAFTTTGFSADVDVPDLVLEFLGGTYPKAISSKAVDVTYEINLADGKPKVSASPDYTTWDD